MNGFERPGVHRFSDDHNLSGVWVSQQGVSHVGLTFVDLGDALAFELATVKKTLVEPKGASDPNAGSNVWILHLSGAEVKQEPVDWATLKRQYLVAPTDLDPEHAKTFPTYLANVVLNAKCQNIPFGVNWLGSKGKINSDGLFVPTDGEEGFTCATFVCEVFRGFGLHVANPEGWEGKEEDTEDWRQQLAESLASNGNTEQDTIDRILRASPIVRLMPAQMAAGATLSPTQWPISSEGVQALVDEILADFAAAYPPPVKKAAPANADATQTNQVSQLRGATTDGAGD